MEEHRVNLTIEEHLAPQMEQLRKLSYDDYICDRDQFDEQGSVHVTAWQASEPVGMVRLTFGSRSALAEWSRGQYVPPPIQNVVEMTRGVVHPDFRRHGIYKALMFEAMIHAEKIGMRMAVAAVRPDFSGKHFLESLGFVDAGGLCWFDDHFLAQPIQCELSYKTLWETKYSEHQSHMVQRGVRIGPAHFL